MAKEGDGFSDPVTKHLTLTFDTSKVNNGDIAHLTIAATAAPTKGNELLFTILSTKGKLTHYTPILVGAYP